MRDDVVAVGTACGPRAPREHAGLVDEGGLLDQSVGCFVRRAGEVLVQVDHRPHRDGGPGCAAPGADLVNAHEAAGVLHASQVRAVLVGDCFVGDVDVEHDLAARAVQLLRRTDAGRRPVRLLGVSVQNFCRQADTKDDGGGLPFADEPPESPGTC